MTTPLERTQPYANNKQNTIQSCQIITDKYLYIGWYGSRKMSIFITHDDYRISQCF